MPRSTRANKNERSEAIELISLMDSIIKRNTWEIKSVGGEITLNTGEKRMFPDVLLCGDAGRTQFLQGWEIKMPDVKITDDAFKSDACRKADALDLNSCVIWNFAYGVLYIKTDGVWSKAKEWDSSKHIRTRPDVTIYKADWESVIFDILYTLNGYFVSGELRRARLGDIITNTVFTELLFRNKNITAEHMREKGVGDVEITANISDWWRSVEKEYKFDGADKFSAYAKFVLLNWINKITFAHMIKGNHNPAAAVERIVEELAPTDALKIFEEITEKCDFFNIFGAVPYGELLPASAWEDLVEYNTFLSENGIAQIPQPALQSILENSVTQFKQSVAGLYTTPIKLAEILVKAGIRDLRAYAIDPCCGTGTIAKEILDAKEHAIGIKEAFATTYAADKFSFPLQISNIAMTRATAMSLPSLLFRSNAFELHENKEIEITDPQNGKKRIYKLPKWGSVISNLPFVPFDIEGRDESANIAAVTKRVCAKIGKGLSGRADLYQAILLDLHESLADNANVAVITSNSWLGTAAGYEFFQILNHYYHIESIVASGKGRWFNNAKVVALMLFLKKKAEPKSPELSHKISFGLIHEKLSDLSDDCATKIAESIILKRTNDASLISFRQYTIQQIEHIVGMNLSLNSLFYDVSWILGVKKKLVLISSVFEAARGERRGWNAMFHLPKGHKIEAQYVKRMLKSSRNISSLTATTDTDAFCCSASVDELIERSHNGALEWIRNFEDKTNETGQPLVEVLHKSGLSWYEMRDNELAEIVTSQKPNQRLFFAKSEKSIFVNQNIVGFNSRDSYPDVELNHALLNSIIGMFYIEASGFGRGQGVLDVSATNIIRSYMLNPKFVDKEQRAVIMDKFDKLMNRGVYNTDAELSDEGRLEFEMAVAKCFGYSDSFEKIKDAVLEMQKVRLSVR